MQFEYNKQWIPQNLIDIDQVGEFGIEASNDEGYFYYLVVKTIYGISMVATCGPVIPDFAQLPSGFKMTLDKVPYKEDKLAKQISFFLNDKSKAITDAKILDINEAIEQFKELKDYMKNLDKETF